MQIFTCVYILVGIQPQGLGMLNKYITTDWCPFFQGTNFLKSAHQVFTKFCPWKKKQTKTKNPSWSWQDGSVGKSSCLKSDDLSLSPGTRVVEGGSQPHGLLLNSTHKPRYVPISIRRHLQTQNK